MNDYTSTTAKRKAVVARLRALDLADGSHENLSAIARAVYHADFGWTHGACKALRDKLVALLEDANEPDSECVCTCGAHRDCDHAEQDEDRVSLSMEKTDKAGGRREVWIETSMTDGQFILLLEEMHDFMMGEQG